MKSVKRINGYVIAELNKKEQEEKNTKFQIFTADEWAQAPGCRYPEYDDVETLEAAIALVDPKAAQEEKVLAEMVITLAHIRDAQKNADAYYSAATITTNMNNYFVGLQFAFEALTGREIHWGNDGHYYLVELVNGQEKILKVLDNEEDKVNA